MKLIGSDNFTIERRKYSWIIESRDEGSQEYLYVNEEQVYELINLLKKAEENLINK